MTERVNLFLGAQRGSAVRLKADLPEQKHFEVHSRVALLKLLVGGDGIIAFR